MSDLKTELDKLLAAASAPPAPGPVFTGTTNETLVPTPLPAPPQADPVRKVTSKAEFDDAVAKATGPVAVLFTQADCGYCEDDQKKLADIAAKCPGQLTALEVDGGLNDELDKLADDFDVEGTPTILFAEKSSNMTPKKAREVEAEQLQRKLKCARTPRGKK